jgi:hypothetical protein
MATEDYEIICPCGGEYTVRLTGDRYGCVRCCAEVALPPLWLDSEREDLDAREAEADSFIDGWINEAFT